MAKYHNLVKVYKEDIEYIKSLEQTYDTLMKRIGAIDLDSRSDLDTIEEFVSLHERAKDMADDLLLARYLLSQDIEAEYADVPLHGPRQAGIDGFYREAGLEQ